MTNSDLIMYGYSENEDDIEVEEFLSLEIGSGFSIS
jgi:hypothetical protein